MNETKGNLGTPTGNGVERRFTASSAKLTPLVYWAQTETQVTLKVELKDAQAAFVDFSPNSVSFSAKAMGACGINEYRFQLKFYEEINESFYKVSDSRIDIFINKAIKGWWPRLIATPQKPHWLKIDFDRWRTEDEIEEKPRDIMQDYSQEYERLQKQEFGYIKESTKKVYMVFYNLAQFIGYLYIVLVISILYFRDGPASMAKTYSSVGNVMKFCQLLQYLEVLHPIFGYTKGGPLLPFFQVTGRNFVLFIMIEMEQRMQTKPVIFYVFLIWALVEIFRYPYYISQLLNKEVGLLTWIRYTIWIPLYPMGVLCEGIIILRNIPYFEETKRLAVEMPNRWNFTFDMPLFMRAYLVLLIFPATYFLMTHMANTRAKKLRYGTRGRRQHVK